MTQHAFVSPDSVSTGEAGISGTFTVDGNKLPRSVPTDRVTATVTNPNPPQVALPPFTSIADQRRKFLENVLVWPADINSPTGWINVHVNAKNDDPAKNGGKPWVVGWPFKTIDDVLNCISWVDSMAPAFYNVWVCMSQQSECTKKSNDKLKAVRKAVNATQLKSIWIDCDVKPGDAKHYHTFTEALDALEAFHNKVGLPLPTATVHTGGGFHLHWVSDTPLSVSDWRAYADGLKALLLREGIKCDAGLTTDAARILRVPGTLNHKYTPPRPVELLHFGTPYNFARDISFLKDFNSAAQHQTQLVAQQSEQREVIEPGAVFDAPDAAFAALSPDNALQAGIEQSGPFLVDPRPIFGKDGCAFLREAFRTGGRDYDNPQWNLSVLCTAFMENGNVIAHEISKGHATYTPADTQALYDRKVADRADRGIGYPSCAAIAGAGCKHCQTCPHFPKGKSPLNIRPPVSTTPEVDFVNPYDEFVAPPFPFEILSPTLRIFVDTVSQAMGADPSATAMAALTGISGAMNAETTVRLADGWPEEPIIWTLLVGAPSSLKSPIIKKTTCPLGKIDHERGKIYKQQRLQWLPNKKTVPAPEAPPRCVINDITPEKAAEILSRAACGSLLVQDEIAGWIENFDRYNSGSRSFYLQTWNGGPFNKDRVGKGNEDLGAEICIDNLALSILGGIQPDKVAKLGDLTDDGLLQRFLVVLMKPASLPDTRTPVAAAEGDYERLIRSVNDVPPQQFRLEDGACEVRDDLLRYLHDLERIDGFPAGLLAAIGKLKGYFGRLCLVLHMTKIHDPTGHGAADPSTFTPNDAEQLRNLMGLAPDNSLSAGTNWSESITRDTAEQADKLIRQFLLPHLFGFYDVVVNGGKERERLRRLADFVLSTDEDRLRPSDFTAGVRFLRGEADNRLREWIGRLCAMDWLVAGESKPGVPVKAWHVAPGLREHFAKRREQAQAARAEAHKILKAGGTRGSR